MDRRASAVCVCESDTREEPMCANRNEKKTRRQVKFPTKKWKQARFTVDRSEYNNVRSVHNKTKTIITLDHLTAKSTAAAATTRYLYFHEFSLTDLQSGMRMRNRFVRRAHFFILFIIIYHRFTHDKMPIKNSNETKMNT